MAQVAGGKYKFVACAHGRGYDVIFAQKKEQGIYNNFYLMPPQMEGHATAPTVSLIQGPI